MVLKHPFQLQPGRRDTVIHPILIAEVLSDSTQGYDRGEKFAAYRTIPTLQEYVLIDQYQPHIEQYVKQSQHQWLFTEYDGIDAQLSLVSVPVTLAAADLYENVEF